MSITVGEMRNRLVEWLSRAEAGEEITVTSYGLPLRRGSPC
jgi:prevent-host-death family protein